MALFNFGSGFKKNDKFKKMEKTIEELSKLEVFIGYNASSGNYEDGVTVLEIAVFNAFGTEHIPSRPFIQNVDLGRRNEINNFIKAQVKAGLDAGSDARKIMNTIGVYVKGIIQDEIVTGNWVPNAPSTIKRKGSNKPLIDTGRMRQSVIYVVREKGS